jgi:alpha-galactosidase
MRTRSGRRQLQTRTVTDTRNGWMTRLGIASLWFLGATAVAPLASDPDMLEVGKLASDTEDRAHFSMWALMAAPLLAGNDVRSMSAATKTVLTNTEVIAIDQDPRGIQGKLVASPSSNLQVWVKQLSGTNTVAVALLNRGSSPASITAEWSALGIAAGPASVRDLWAHADLGTFDGAYTASSVPSHGVTMLKLVATP